MVCGEWHHFKDLSLSRCTGVDQLSCSLSDLQLFELDEQALNVHSQLREVCISSAVEGRSTVLLVSSSGHQHWESVCQMMNEGIITLVVLIFVTHTHTHTHTQTHTHTHTHKHTHTHTHTNTHTLTQTHTHTHTLWCSFPCRALSWVVHFF